MVLPVAAGNGAQCLAVKYHPMSQTLFKFLPEKYEESQNVIFLVDFDCSPTSFQHLAWCQCGGDGTNGASSYCWKWSTAVKYHSMSQTLLKFLPEEYGKSRFCNFAGDV